MVNSKLKRIVFLALLALLAGGSCSVYSSLEMNFFLKTIGLLGIQQLGGIIIYFSCFGIPDFNRSRSNSDHHNLKKVNIPG